MEFNRIITLLRKERGITQKQASIDLGVSQALLSHYEKGIRECGLDFVVKVSEYYNVSCDYLLGRSAERSGQTLSAEDIPSPDSSPDSHLKRGGAMAIMSKKLIANSLNILYDKLGASQNRALVNEVTAYLMLSVYRMFRLIYTAAPKNASSLFGLSSGRWEGYSDAAAKVAEANVKALLMGEAMDDTHPGLKDGSCFAMTTDSLGQEYPLYVSSLLNLIKSSEARVEK